MRKYNMDKMKKKLYMVLAVGLMASVATGCGASSTNNGQNAQEETVTENSGDTTQTETGSVEETNFEGTTIALSDDGIQVDGVDASTDSSDAVYVGADIIYYEEGNDDTYGAGSEEDGHSAEEAAQHTVITITQPGEYKVSGDLSYGQIAIDLGEDAEDDENAVVTLILDNANITCTVASAIVVYNAYECGSDDVDTATKDVDTTNAGFNLVIADNSENTMTGSHVAKIYKEGTTDKLHKYDATIESKVSFNINGETLGNGKLTVNADNEGIESSLHLTINGGEITINSGDDAINASEDSVSVLTINDGIVTCDSGSGSEGDGIDSNGWIIINGGYTIACANPQSQDSGVDSDLGIYINGGTLLATGNMYDEVSDDSAQNFMVLGFSETQSESDYILIKDSEGNAITAFNAVNDYTMLVYSSADLQEGDYTLYSVSSVEGDLNGSIYTNITDYTDEVQLQYTSSSMMGMGGGMGPGNGGAPSGEMPTDGEAPEMPADGEMPTDGEAPEMPTDGETTTDGEAPEMPADGEQPTDGEAPAGGDGQQTSEETTGEASTTFSLAEGSYTFSGITAVTEE